jgi:hypothetical protein
VGEHGGRAHPATRSRRSLVAATGLLLLSVLVGALALLLRDSPVTVDGRDVADPEGVLATAEHRLDDQVRERHGARGEDTRCWFHLRDAEGSDVRDTLVCGPVLFVDGDPRRAWLRFPVTATRGDDDVVLTVADEPVAPGPGARPAADLLRRPDGGSPPEGAGGVAVPEPVRAEPGLRTTGPLAGVDLTAPEGPARLSGPAAAVTVTGLARPDRVGAGDVARRPAEGEQFLAVTYRYDAGEGTATDVPALSYEVPGADPLPVDPALLVPGATVTELLSVPADVDAADLVVRDAGLEQRLSLFTGAPGPGNVEVLGRVNRRVELGVATELTATAGGPGRPGAPVRFAVAMGAAQLRYLAGAGTVKQPAGPDRAFLVVDATMTPLGRPPIAVPPGLLTLTLPDGTVVPALDLADDPAVVQPAFDVPGSFTDGVLGLAGTAGYPDGSSADLGSARLDVPVAIPPG